MKKYAIIEWAIIAFVALVCLSGCTGLQKAIVSSGWLDGKIQVQAKDVDKIAQYCDALGVDPNTITIGQLMGIDPKPAKEETVVIRRSDLEKLIEAAAKAPKE